LVMISGHALTVTGPVARGCQVSEAGNVRLLALSGLVMATTSASRGELHA
jgi:hypothetical protein